MNPVTPYGAAKAFAVHLTRIYRKSFRLYACNAICFNHESPRRDSSFVTRKITQAAVRIKLGLQDQLHLGNVHSRRVWGFAGDYVRGMWQILQQDVSSDSVLATGRSTTVQEFLTLAFNHVGLDWQKYVVVDENLIRPADSHLLVGDASRAIRELGWRPETSLEKRVDLMIAADFAIADLNLHWRP